jgi:hypothetical protein
MAKYHGPSDPVVSRILWRRRVLGMNFTFRLALHVSNWRKLAWPLPLNLTADDNE